MVLVKLFTLDRNNFLYFLLAVVTIYLNTLLENKLLVRLFLNTHQKAFSDTHYH